MSYVRDLLELLMPWFCFKYLFNLLSVFKVKLFLILIEFLHDTVTEYFLNYDFTKRTDVTRHRLYWFRRSLSSGK